MGWIPFRQRRGALCGQYVDAARSVDAIFIRAVPRPFSQRHNAWHHAWRDFGVNLNFATAIEYPHNIAIFDVAFSGIEWVNQHFLTTSGFQYIDVAVSRVSSGFVMESCEL
ncbi:Uncharacterised protein [Yersinia enterocolitica]|nr:Uncharacterised protein [Yersinia enterocolitica]